MARSPLIQTYHHLTLTISHKHDMNHITVPLASNTVHKNIIFEPLISKLGRKSVISATPRGSEGFLVEVSGKCTGAKTDEHQKMKVLDSQVHIRFWSNETD